MVEAGKTEKTGVKPKQSLIATYGDQGWVKRPNDQGVMQWVTSEGLTAKQFAIQQSKAASLKREEYQAQAKAENRAKKKAEYESQENRSYDTFEEYEQKVLIPNRERRAEAQKTA